MRFLALAVLFGFALLACAQRPAQPGAFDFYLFTLSWAPEYCHNHRDTWECDGRHGFVVHGLWPQNSDGSYPADCPTNQPGPRDTSAVADIMPRSILQHEWEKHGTCSGLSGDEYFRLIRKLYEALRVPDDFHLPQVSFVMRPPQLKKDFESANSALRDEGIRIQVKSGYLNGVEICYAKSGAPTACSHVPDAPDARFKVPPVRRQ